MAKSLKNPRSIAYSRQNGCCYYCEQPMWTINPFEFSKKYKATLRQAMLFQCTAEHLIAYQDGGSSAQHNIVAACWNCNQRRHKRKIVLSSEQYKELVCKRMSQNRWLDFRLDCSDLPAGLSL